jgi:hypothetical protein
MSKRGIRRVSMRVRLAVAAAVLVGGGAAGVAVVAANHSGDTVAQSAGYYSRSGQWMSETQALSSAMSSWNRSPSTSLTTLSHMQKMSTVSTMSWHHATLVLQRGTVVATGHNEIVVKSTNGAFDIWHLNGGTKTLNVGGSSTGMSAMSGGTMNVPSWWRMNTKTHGIAKGDVVFVFGERENHTLKAQLVLFAAPMTTTVRPTATTTTTPTATPTATSTSTATPTATATPTTPTGGTSTTTINGTPVISGTHS